MSDGTNAADVLRDDELASTHADPTRTAIEERLKDVHTAMFGIIRSFNAAKQTATVQPVIKRIWVDDGALALPECQDVPVHFPRGGKFVLTFPVSPGDECLLVFSERAFDNWFANGGTQEPSEYRLHDLSDAIALVGFSSMPNVVADLATDATELRTLDGTTTFRLEGDTAYVGGKAGAVKMLMGETYRTAEGQLDQALIAAIPAVVTALSAIPASGAEFVAFTALYPTIAAFFAVLGTFLGGAWLPALQAFEAQDPTFLARQAKVR